MGESRVSMRPCSIWIKRVALDVILVLAVVGIGAIQALHNIGDLGIGYDEGVFLTAGSSIASGRVMYRDIFDHKTPFLHILLSLVAPSPSQVVQVRLLQGLVLIAVALLLFATTKMIHGSLAGLLAAFFFVTDPLVTFFRVAAYTENWLNVFGIACLTCLVAYAKSRGTSKVWILLAGGTAAMAFWANQFGIGIVVLVFFAVLWVGFQTRTTHESLGRLVLAGVGILVASTPFIAYIVINSAQISFIRDIFLMPLAENASVATGDPLAMIGFLLRVIESSIYSPPPALAYNMVLWPAFLAYLVYTAWQWKRQGKTDVRVLVVICFSVLIFFISASSHRWEQHVLLTTPLMSLGTAAFTVELAKWHLRHARARRRPWTSLAGLHRSHGARTPDIHCCGFRTYSNIISEDGRVRTRSTAVANHRCDRQSDNQRSGDYCTLTT